MSFSNSSPESADFARLVSRDDSRDFNSKRGIYTLPSLPTIKAPQESGPVDDDSPVLSPKHQFIEFDLSSHGQPSDRISIEVLRSRHDSHLDLPALPDDPITSEKTDEPKGNDDFFTSEHSGWKSMKKVAEENYYDEMGNLEFSQDNRPFSHRDTRGYTRIDTEEQLNKYAKLDKKTDFLFEIQTSKDKKIDQNEEDFDYGDDNIDSEETLAGTRGMLTDSQKFAYIGIVKLIIVDMATDLAKLNQKTNNKVAKKLATGQKNFANWTMYIMSKLVDHLEITKQENSMIDSLSKHGVEVTDLTVGLVKTEIQNRRLEKLTLDFDLRWVLICDLFLLLLSDGYYDSRSRTLLVHFSKSLEVSNLEVLQFERRLIESLEMDTSSKTIENRDDKMKDRLFIDKHIQKNRKRRLAYIGLATLGGSLAIGLSAGLLAPVIGAGLAAGLTTVGITGTSSFLAGIGGSVAIATGGVAVGAKVGSKAGARRLGDVQTFELTPLHNNKRSNLIITVSGWMNGEMDDVRLPFSTVDPVMGDIFSLLWEPEMLQSMGQTIGILASEALSTSIQQILGATILTALMSAIQLPMALSKLSYLLDNPWNVSLDRAWKGGKLLADTLISGNMGVRPITLVGFSLGSRLIYSCLIELANRGGFGLIENVIILGSPVSVKYDQITLARSVVSGRFINGYTKKDWILGYLFRATGGGLRNVAGISPIEDIPGVENFDCTKFVEGHMEYRKAIPVILKSMDWEVLSEEFAEIEEPDPEHGERTRKLIDEFDVARAKMEKETAEEAAKQKTWKDWFRPKQKNWWEVYDEGARQEDQDTRPEFEEYHETPHQTTGVQSQALEPVETVPIFDVSALLQEVNGIEKIGDESADVLQEVMHNVEPPHQVLKTNEDLEEEVNAAPTVLGSIGSKLTSPLGKKPEES